MLANEEFKQLIEYAPLVAIDIVIIDVVGKVLFGKRLNPPAKDSWFIPGGRVRKNETLDSAFKRVSELELGVEMDRSNAEFLGLYEHFYADSFFDGQSSTHYICATYLVKKDFLGGELPIDKQHSNYKWLPVDEIFSDLSVHSNSKLFIPDLMKRKNSD